MYSELQPTGRGHWPDSFYKKVREISAYSTMSTNRVYAIIESVHHVLTQGIPGDMAEFGVYHGGNLALISYELDSRGDYRRLWAYDTFSGVPHDELEPGDIERSNAEHASKRYNDGKWCSASIDLVRINVDAAYAGMCDAISSTGRGVSASQNISWVHGSVLDTVPGSLPDRFSFLRLDMDIAKPTRHVLPLVWERLSIGGIMHIDDYNAFDGVKAVIDEFMAGKMAYIHEIDSNAVAIVRLK